MVMLPSLQCVAASFLSTYYTKFVTLPQELKELYTDDACISHLGRTGTGKDEVELVLHDYLAPGKSPFATAVEIGTITVKEAGGNMATPQSPPKAILVKVTGTISKGDKDSSCVPFAQEFELHEVGPLCYGIARDVFSGDIAGLDMLSTVATSSSGIASTLQSSGNGSGQNNKKSSGSGKENGSSLRISSSDVSGGNTLGSADSFVAALKSRPNAPPSAATVVCFSDAASNSPVEVKNEESPPKKNNVKIQPPKSDNRAKADRKGKAAGTASSTKKGTTA